MIFIPPSYGLFVTELPKQKTMTRTRKLYFNFSTIQGYSQLRMHIFIVIKKIAVKK